MIFGIQTEIYKNLKNQDILHIKKTERYYFLNGKNLRATNILKTIPVNAISIPLVISIFFKLPVWILVLIGAAVYIGYLYYYNTNIAPMLPNAKGKDIQRKPEVKKESKTSQMVRGVLFLAIAAGLVIGILLDQAEGDLRIMAMVGAVIGLVLGTQEIYKANLSD